MADTPQNNQTQAAESGKLTPELVRKVADKVAAMWQRDLTIDRERQRFGQGSQTR